MGRLESITKSLWRKLASEDDLIFFRFAHKDVSEFENNCL